MGVSEGMRAVKVRRRRAMRHAAAQVKWLVLERARTGDDRIRSWPAVASWEVFKRFLWDGYAAFVSGLDTVSMLIAADAVLKGQGYPAYGRCAGALGRRGAG